MEEKETGESEPADLQCAEQTDLVSLIVISGEEEATQEESDLGHCSGGGKNIVMFMFGLREPVCQTLVRPPPAFVTQLIRVTDNAM